MALLPSLLVLSTALFTLVRGQAEPQAQCNASTAYDWASNSRGQDVCDMARYLGGVCSDGTFTIAPLDQGQIYTGPDEATANGCRCSSVFYSLLSACASCQDRNYQRWSRYNRNCSTVAVGIFPEEIPSGTSIPHWAYLDISEWDDYNSTAAFQDAQTNGASAESTSPPEPSETSSPSGPSGTSGPSDSETSETPSGGSGGGSNAGAIAGGVIGGVAGLAIIAAFVFWLLRRRRQRNTLPPSATAPQMGYRSPSPTLHAQAAQSAKYYDPSDPSTFPTSTSPFQNSTSPIPSMYTTGAHDTSTINTTQPLQPNRLYTGAPEV